MIHLLVVLTMWISHEQRFLQTDTLRDFIDVYFFILPLLLIGLFFKNLRNFNFFIIWLTIGLIQLLTYPELHDLTGFQFYRGSAFDGLRSLLPTLLVFQLLRIVFIRTHNQELIISIRLFRMTMWEEEENRNMTWLEVGFSLTIALTAVFSNVYE
ncbi:MAG: hypothetical protein ABJK91_11985 [Nonlabens ulvanivorans]